MKICIAQLIKDETRYIEEWVEFYLNLGIEKFILIEDINSVSHKDVLDKYGDSIELKRLEEITDVNKIIYDELRQNYVWEYVYNNYKNTYDACLFVDPDEFLDCTKEQFLDEAIRNFNNPRIIGIYYYWRIMTASGHILDPNPNGKYSVVQTYNKPWNIYRTKRIVQMLGKTKPLIFFNKISKIDEFHVPHIFERKKIKNVNLVPMISSIRLRHYITKSFEEYKFRLFKKGEQLKQCARNIGMFFMINSDLRKYKDELLESCKDEKFLYNNDIIFNIN